MHMNEYTGSCITVPLILNFGITFIYIAYCNCILHSGEESRTYS